MHGITREFLQGKPRFADVHADILEFISDAEGHHTQRPIRRSVPQSRNSRGLGTRACGWKRCCRILDSLALARQLHPGQRNSLDALCRRYQIDNSARQLHGALLDAEILADVYLAMTGGQAVLELGSAGETAAVASGLRGESRGRRAGSIPVVRASPEELEAHSNQLDYIDEMSDRQCLWLQREYN